jgi:hypothetical protein
MGLRTYFAQPIGAPDDAKGNPQRGWIIYNVSKSGTYAEVAGFIPQDRDRNGLAQLRKKMRSRVGNANVIEALFSISVSQAAWRKFAYTFGWEPLR